MHCGCYVELGQSVSLGFGHKTMPRYPAIDYFLNSIALSSSFISSVSSIDNELGCP